MSDEAEQIIRDWIDSKCDPSPYSPEESFRRVMNGIAEAVNTVREAFREAVLQLDWPDTDEGWELANG